jgi:hypothetical protein
LDSDKFAQPVNTGQTSTNSSRSNLQTVRAYSWFLAAAYLVCGGICAYFVKSQSSIYASANMPLPGLARLIVSIGAENLMLLAVFGAATVAVKDLIVHSKLLDVFFTVALIWALTAMYVALTFDGVPSRIP